MRVSSQWVCYSSSKSATSMKSTIPPPQQQLLLTVLLGLLLVSTGLAFPGVQQLCGAVQRAETNRGRRPSTTTTTAKVHVAADSVRRGGGGGECPKKSRKNVLEWYSQMVNEKPLLTKAATAGLAAALGDMFAQLVLVSSSQPPDISWRRVVAFLLTGTFFVGPYLHLWYGQLDTMLGRLRQSHIARTFSKMLIDQTVGVTIFFPMYFVAYELAESVVTGRGMLEAMPFLFRGLHF